MKTWMFLALLTAQFGFTWLAFSDCSKEINFYKDLNYERTSSLTDKIYRLQDDVQILKNKEFYGR